MSRNNNLCINNIIKSSKKVSMSILDTKYEFKISKPLQKYPIWYYCKKVKTELDIQYHSGNILCIQTSNQEGFKIEFCPFFFPPIDDVFVVLKGVSIISPTNRPIENPQS